MGNRSKYRRLPELYIRGGELVFDTEDGPLVMWLQVLNPFEAQECRNDAQTARARLAMALKRPGSGEHDQMESAFVVRGRIVTIEDMLSAKQTGWFIEATHNIEVDADWQERMEVLRSGDVTPGSPLSSEEQKLLADLNVEYMQEIDRRTSEDAAYYRETLTRMTDVELMDEYLDVYISRRGDNIALVEYNLSEILYGTRVCEAVPGPDGTFNASSHEGCRHKDRVWESREEVRELPTEMQRLLREKFDDLAMSARDAKSSGSKASSSDSSPVPAPQEVLSPSTGQDLALSTAPGTSP